MWRFATEYPPSNQPKATAEQSLEVQEAFEQAIRDGIDTQQTPAEQDLIESCAQLSQCEARQALFERYLAYKEQLAELMAHKAALSIEEQYLLMLNQQQTLFSESEQALLFEHNNTWNQYMIERLQLANDTQLTVEQQAELAQQLLEQQPESIRASYRNTQQLVIASDSELSFNQLAAQLGSEAASQLENVKLQENRWLTRVNKAKAALANMPDAQARQDYLHNHFDVSERKRLAVYLN